MTTEEKAPPKPRKPRKSRAKVPGEQQKRGPKPFAFTDDQRDTFFSLLISGMSVSDICKRDDMPDDMTFYRLLLRDKEIENMYRLAREAQAERFFDEIVKISDDGTNDYREEVDEETGEVRKVIDHDHIQRSKLRVDTRKWAMARISAKKYSERVVNELVGKDDGPIQTANTHTPMTLEQFYGQFGRNPAVDGAGADNSDTGGDDGTNA